MASFWVSQRNIHNIFLSLHPLNIPRRYECCIIVYLSKRKQEARSRVDQGHSYSEECQVSQPQAPEGKPPTFLSCLRLLGRFVSIWLRNIFIKWKLQSSLDQTKWKQNRPSQSRELITPYSTHSHSIPKAPKTALWNMTGSPLPHPMLPFRSYRMDCSPLEGWRGARGN